MSTERGTVKRILAGLVTATAALSLTACGLFEPSLEERAVAASKPIAEDFQRQKDVVADLEAQMAQVQAKIDARVAEAKPAEDAYMESNTDEMIALQDEYEQAYEAAEAADDAWYNADWENEAEYEQLEEASGAAWDAYYAKGDEVSALEEKYTAQYEASQRQLEEDLKPLNKELDRLGALSVESYNGQDIEMSFSLMAACPELAEMDFSDFEGMKNTIAETEPTEICVTTLETWAEKVSE